MFVYWGVLRVRNLETVKNKPQHPLFYHPVEKKGKMYTLLFYPIVKFFFSIGNCNELPNSHSPLLLGWYSPFHCQGVKGAQHQNGISGNFFLNVTKVNPY